MTSKHLIYYHHPNVEPRRRELLDNLILEWPGEFRGKFYAIKIKYKGKSKLAMLIGCKTPDEGLEWANAINKSKPEVAEENNIDSRNRNMSTRMACASVKYNQSNIPKFMQAGYNLLTSTDQWKLIGDMTYTKDHWIKNVLLVPAPIETVAEAIQLKRIEWDWTFTEYRIVFNVDPFKFIKVGMDNKHTVIMSGIVPDIPFAIYICNESVNHAHYISNISYVEYYCIRQHPYNTSSSLVTRVTTLPDILPSIHGLRSYLEIQDFRASAADIPLGQILNEPDSVEETNSTSYGDQVSFNEYFVYGDGGNYERDSVNGGLVLKDKSLISKQKHVITHLLRSAGKNLIKGKGIMDVSLPVNIFESRSLLQRLLNSFGYAPIYLEAAGRETGLERFKNVVTFGISMLHLSTEQRKPFNPIIGETVQGLIGDMEVYAEQTFHHPPISHHYSVGKNFRMRGYHEFTANTSANSVKARQKNGLEVIFESHSVFISMPTCMITGLVIGKRVFNWAGVMTFMDPENRLFLEIVLNPEKKGSISGMFSKSTTTSDYFKGTIYKVARSHPMMNPKLRTTICNGGKNPIEFNREDVEDQLGVVEGAWPVELSIDGNKYWRFADSRPYRLRPGNDLLPSDSSLRKDLYLLSRGEEEKAQEKKDILENQQKNDKKLRKAAI